MQACVVLLLYISFKYTHTHADISTCALFHVLTDIIIIIVHSCVRMYIPKQHMKIFPSS